MQTILSVRLAKIDLGHQKLTLKVFYPEKKAEEKDPNNELDGFCNYVPVAKKLKDSLEPVYLTQCLVNVHGDLITNLKAQGIQQGEIEFKLKLKDQEVKKDPSVFRLYGTANHVNINHGKFRDTDQKLNATGNSVEPLRWAIKLQCVDQQISSEKLKLLQQDVEFSNAVSQIIREKLGAGKALEIANQAIHQLAQEKLKSLGVEYKEITLQLKRRELMDAAEVVISETHTSSRSQPNADQLEVINLPITDSIKFAHSLSTQLFRHRFDFTLANL